MVYWLELGGVKSFGVAVVGVAAELGPTMLISLWSIRVEVRKVCTQTILSYMLLEFVSYG
jgi:hypothetical protein